MTLRWMFAAVSALSFAAPAIAAEPFDSMQGMWYDVNHKVAVEITGQQVVVREVDTKDITINKHGWAPGSLIAEYSGAKQDRESFSLSGRCWDFASNTLVEPCLDNATHFDRPGTKPFWSLTVAGLTLWRRNHFSPTEWSSRD